MSTSLNSLGAFLRSSRARANPAASGLLVHGSRRVAGLRREEVAVLAGMSADYYARLEQGRERHPSPQMVNAVGRALGLDDTARAHLFTLAGLAPLMTSGSSHDPVHPTLLRLMDDFPNSAAYVLSPSFDALGSNQIGAELLSPFDGADNLVWALFKHPDARTTFIEWPEVARVIVHVLRLNSGRYPNDWGIHSLVEDLLITSDDFRQLWNEQTVDHLCRSAKALHHPQVGRVELTFHFFDVCDAHGQQLLVGAPEPGTPSAQAVALLGSQRFAQPRHNVSR
jgi:transcriptional regulator with XRE-family HTH domain